MILRYLWPAIVWSVLVLILTLIPGEALPEVSYIHTDKLVHFFFFGTLIILAAYGLTKSFARKNVHANASLIAIIYSTLFGLMIEFIQQFVPGRSSSFADMIANTIGVVLGYLVFAYARNKIKALS